MLRLPVRQIVFSWAKQGLVFSNSEDENDNDTDSFCLNKAVSKIKSPLYKVFQRFDVTGAAGP